MPIPDADEYDHLDATMQAPFGLEGAGIAAKRLPVLIVLKGAQIGRRYLLNENKLVLGRRADKAGLVIPGDPQISSAHCRIEFRPQFDAWVLVDLGSTNGTRVGSEKVTSAELHEGDRIHVGQTVLKFTYHDELEEEFHRHVDHLMNVDDLTGLPVQRVYKQRFVETFRDAVLRREPLAVYMMDMDGLKKINDTHGHHLGAHSIATVGRRLGVLVDAAGGTLSRFGGDEFSAFVPRLDREGALGLGEQLRAAVANEAIELSGVVVNPTMSIGVAVFPDDGDTPEGLTRHADEALYRAKHAGRNRVSL